ncbi:glycerophosphoryl diester phosphodiesterase [Actinomadura coerulea]|uniref:Glycerophosphoryl diester phosphodiesterase n=1 Tax=Actinomadura coerulea TaxID=46159 RepID=A0A7X0L165_9ACTN|nr:glycerophosphodiester phosphodiesterase family protein [Actinomadura coerulea]MBB6398192.1 glycerophosphoryl diester phosphodiesterase [Actinomadura coerulea]GGQ35726.1 putative glycerophosphoryl diester phosphodiesterase precursor (GlpQ) [Actinomadura coerulea]
MSVRLALAGLALASTVAAPASAHAATAGGPGVLPQKTHFDLQAHRGGIGMTTEESLEGFGKAMRLGVSTLELDTHVTKDEKVVVTHDRQVSAQKCRDTAPVTPGDPMYPYVGKYIKDLTLAQIKTMDCGYRQLPGFPEQEVVRGFRMVELKDVLGLVKRYRAKQVKLNIETKVEAGAPEQTAPRELFVRRVFEEIRASGIERQVTIQSFDWGALERMHRLAPGWPLVALTNYDFLQVGRPGASPWLGGLDVDDYGGDFVRAAAAVQGVAALSPNYGFPQNGKVGDPGFRFYPDRAMVARAHARGLKVIPWTCDDPATVEALMDMGVDGVITDYPDRVRQIMSERGMRLPKAYQPR